MQGQLTIFDWLYSDRINPIAEVARKASPYWTTSRADLVKLCNTDPGIDVWTRAVKHEYCPYGFCSSLLNCKPNGLDGYEMRTSNITVQWLDYDGCKQSKTYSWADFAREVADLIWSGEYPVKEDECGEP